MGAVRHASATIGAFGGAPYGATMRVKGVPTRVRVRHASAATGAFGGAPYGATKRCPLCVCVRVRVRVRVCPDCAGRAAVLS